MESSNRTETTPDVPSWQRLTALLALLVVLGLVPNRRVFAQLHDSLDTHPPRWHLSKSDCQARVTDQGHLATGGIEGGACETVSLITGNGTECS